MGAPTHKTKNTIKKILNCVRYLKSMKRDQVQSNIITMLKIALSCFDCDIYLSSDQCFSIFKVEGYLPHFLGF